MSIEQAIVNLTTAINGYTATLEKAMGTMPKTEAVEAKKEAAKPEPKKEAPKAAEPKKAAPAGEDLQEKLLALTTEAVKKHGKAAEVKALLNEFDVKKASELAPEQYSYYFEKLQKIVAAKAPVEEEEDDLI